jgi:HSP20 family protein
MVEKEVKEKKDEAEEKAIEIKKATLEKKEMAEEKAAEVKEAAAQTEEEAEEAARRRGRQAEKVINDFLSGLRSRQEDFSKAWADYTRMDKPLADVIETEGEIIVKTDLPGIKKGDVDVTITEDSVEITAQFKEEYSEEEVDYILRERNYGETKRIIKLPSKVKVKEATAKLEDSILSVNLPKVEKSQFKVDIT